MKKKGVSSEEGGVLKEYEKELTHSSADEVLKGVSLDEEIKGSTKRLKGEAVTYPKKATM